MADTEQEAPQRRLPHWLKVRMPGGANYLEIRDLLRNSALHTVCEEARCPNIGECWERRSATFMILGDICTRRCHYCAVTTGRPVGLDLMEPQRLAQTVARLGLSYCVITSVNRDDLADGGAFIFAQCIKEVHRQVPGCKVEVLTPDFGGSQAALEKVVSARPEVFNHNIETCRRVFHSVRPRGDYDLSLDVLARVKDLDGNMATKSGIIVGMSRGMGRGGGDDAGLEARALRPPDHRTIPAPLAEACAGFPLLHTRGVRPAGRYRTHLGVQACRIGTAST